MSSDHHVAPVTCHMKMSDHNDAHYTLEDTWNVGEKFYMYIGLEIG